MKVIVTGGAGYIGSHAVQRLLDKEYEVIVIDNLSTGWLSLVSPFVTRYKVDVRNIDELDEVFAKEKNINAIFHFAGLIKVGESIEKPLEYFDNNTYGTFNLLKMVKKYNIKNFIFSSTAAVYGNTNNKLIIEESYTNPINPYGESKLAAEKLIISAARVNKFNYIIFRYFNVAGMLNGMRALNEKEKSISQHLLIPSINMFLLKLKKSFVIFGDDYKTKDGSCIRDYIHVVDLVDAHILGFEWSIQENASNIFNLGTRHGFSVKEIICETKKVLNKKFDVEIGEKRLGDPALLVADNSKARRILKWRPKYSLKDMIESDYLFRK